MTLRSDVADLNHGLAGKLLLDVEVVILHVRRFDIAVETEAVALVIARGCRRVGGHSILDSVSCHATGKPGGKNLLRQRHGWGIVERGSGIKVG